MTDIVIERNPDASSINWQDLLALLHKAFAYMDGRIDPPSSLHMMTADSLRQKAQVETLLLARVNHLIAGCMFCREDGAFLYVGKLAVEPENQTTGIGRKLFGAAFQIARNAGMAGLELETRIELTEIHAFFERLGFVKVGESAHAGYDRSTSITMRAILD